MLLKLLSFYSCLLFRIFLCTISFSYAHSFLCRLFIVHQATEYSVIQWSYLCNTTKSKVQLGDHSETTAKDLKGIKKGETSSSHLLLCSQLCLASSRMHCICLEILTLSVLEKSTPKWTLPLHIEYVYCSVQSRTDNMKLMAWRIGANKREKEAGYMGQYLFECIAIQGKMSIPNTLVEKRLP
jgi:hypothetical protein